MGPLVLVWRQVPDGHASGTMSAMDSRPLDDPALLAAMKDYLDACTRLDSAGTDSEVLERSEAKSMAAMSLRKRLSEAGWAAPSRQRTST